MGFLRSSRVFLLLVTLSLVLSTAVLFLRVTSNSPGLHAVLPRVSHQNPTRIVYAAPADSMHRIAVVIAARSNKFPSKQVAALAALRGPKHEIVVVVALSRSDNEQVLLAKVLSEAFLERAAIAVSQVQKLMVMAVRSGNDSLPTYGEMCSAGEKQASASVTHVLFLSEAHVPRDVHFLKRMLEPFSLSASPAWGVQCTIVEGTGDGAAPVDGEPLRSGVIVDHGLELSETVNHVDAPLAAVRRLRGFSVRDARLRRATRVHLISPYCSMWDRKKFVLIGGFASRSKVVSLADCGGLPACSVDSILLEYYHTVRRRVDSCTNVLLRISIDDFQNAHETLRVAVIRVGDVIRRGKRIIQQLEKHFQSNDTMLLENEDPTKREADLTVFRSSEVMAVSDRLEYLRLHLLEAVETVDNLPQRIAMGDELGGWTASMESIRRGGAVYAAPMAFVELLPSLPYAHIGEANALFASFFLPTDFVLLWGQLPYNLARSPNNTGVARVIWDAACCGCCGFATEMAHFIAPLSRIRKMKTTISHTNCFCSGQMKAIEDALQRAYISPTEYESTQTNELTIWISHRSPVFYSQPTTKRRKPNYFIGRNMYEFSRIGQNWVDAMGGINEVWVPAKFVATSFAISGVPKEKLVVIPEAVDTYFFDPDVQDAVPLPLDGTRAKRWIHYCNSDHSSVAASPRAFKFFSNFKWEPRKGWETLFEAYWRAFGSLSRSERPVSLYILTYYFFNATVMGGNIHNVSLILDELTQWARAKLHVESLAEFPHFCIITETITETELAGLYKSADAFVLPTRGEGWCLPAIEAMSMGLPTIATVWGGQTEFMTRDNSFLILPDAVEEPPEDNMYGFELGKKWATPSMNHTAQLMQYVYSHPVHAKHVGERARRHVEEHFSEEAVAAAVEKRIEQICADATGVP